MCKCGCHRGMKELHMNFSFAFSRIVFRAYHISFWMYVMFTSQDSPPYPVKTHPNKQTARAMEEIVRHTPFRGSMFQSIRRTCILSDPKGLLTINVRRIIRSKWPLESVTRIKMSTMFFNTHPWKVRVTHLGRLLLVLVNSWLSKSHKIQQYVMLYYRRCVVCWTLRIIILGSRSTLFFKSFVKKVAYKLIITVLQRFPRSQAVP